MRIGLIGYGLSGRFFHAPLIAGSPGVSLAGVVTSTAVQRAELGRDHPGVAAYADLASLLDAGVDSLVITAALDERPASIAEALHRGLPVLTDAPLALTLTGARALVKAAERYGVALGVYQPRRWDSDLLTVAKLLRDNRLGTVRLFESRLQLEEGPRLGLGVEDSALCSLGSHLVDQALQLFGPVARIYAEAAFQRGDPARDREFFLSLQHASGVIAHLSGSNLQSCPWRLRVVGTQGIYSVEGLDGQARALVQGRTPRNEKGNWGAEEHQRWGWLSRGDERARVPSERGRWDLCYEGWLATLSEGAPPPVALHEALACQAVLEAARLSARTGQSVVLAEGAHPPEVPVAGRSGKALPRSSSPSLSG